MCPENEHRAGPPPDFPAFAALRAGGLFDR
jgi:hypothetical protein